MHTILEGQGHQNAVRRHHGLKAQAKNAWLAGKEIRVTLRARQLDKGAASAAPIRRRW
jgi:hypothetical protein